MLELESNYPHYEITFSTRQLRPRLGLSSTLNQVEDTFRLRNRGEVALIWGGYVL